jgi:Methane oxygenase PmoA
MLRFLFVLVIASACLVTAQGQKIATLEIELATSAQGLDVPVQTNLDAITFLSDTLLSLVEVQGSKKVPVKFQIEAGYVRTLHWIVKPSDKIKKYVYELAKGTGASVQSSVQVKLEGGAATLRSGGKNLLRYQFETVYPPAGIDTAYKRSGFIHPLWSPHGQVLTRIQPPDHYHHYGIWNPWTHVLFEGDTIDFWNLNAKKGTVRFANFTSLTEGQVFGEYKALQEHVVFKKSGQEKVALNEVQSVRIYTSGNPDYYIADVTIAMNCASPSDVLLLEYRYGGFGWRTTEQWNKDNSEILSSEGKTRKDADGTTARWCIVQGAVDNDYAGAVMMSYPTNYNHPEPLRIWPENQYNRGDMFANFSPTKNKDWLLKSGHDYVLKYRLIVYNGHFTKAKAESAWQYFSTPPKVNVKLIK